MTTLVKHSRLLVKAKERSLEQHFRPRAFQTWVVLCNSVDQYLRTMVDLITVRPTPMQIGAVVATCVFSGKTGNDKSKCRLRNAKLQKLWQDATF